MTAGKNWSSVLSTHRPLGGGVMLTEVSMWRRRTGFLDAEKPADSGSDSGPDETAKERARGAQKPRHQGSAFDLRGLHRWLASSPSGLTLHLVLEVGGAQPSQAWLGLSAIGAAEKHARERLRKASAELGEALDAWSLYTDIPLSPPQHPRTGRELRSAAHLTTPSHHIQQDHASLVQSLSILDRRTEALTLGIDIPAGGLSTALVDEIERVYKQATRRLSSPDMQIMALFSGTPPEGVALVETAQALWSGLLGKQVRLHLHGSIPGPLLLRPLLDALEVLLGVELELSEAETEIGPATPGIDLNPLGLLGTMTIGGNQAVFSSATVQADDIPF